MSDLSTLTPRAREAHDALTEAINRYADVFMAECMDHEEKDCGCPERMLTGWVLVHEWTRLADGASSMTWNSAPGVGYYQAIGLLHAAGRLD